MSFKVGYIEGYGSARGKLLLKAARALKRELGLNVEVKIRYAEANRSTLTDEFMSWVKERADALILHIHPSAKDYNKVKELVEQVTIPVLSIEYGYESLSRNVDLELLSKFREYFIYGGLENLKNMLIFLAKITGKTKAEPAQPKPVPWVGIYHPKSTKLFTELNEYLEWYYSEVWRNRGRPSNFIGMLLYRDFVLEENTVVADALIYELERRGYGVIPVFTWLGLKNAYSDLLPRNTDREESRGPLQYFMDREGKVIIDLLISLQDFTLTPRPIGAWVESTGESKLLLSRLDVPVIKGVVMYYKTVDEWLKSNEGVDYMTLAMGVVMPEVDGVIEPIVIGSAKEEVDAESGSAWKTYFPIEHQVKYLVERVTKWIQLKMKVPRERRVAIVLHNKPCEGVEATIGLGFGLDTFESVVRLLKSLREKGYNVGERLPEKGEELAQMILERRALPDFRWTPVSETVVRGGALDLISLEEYIKYFETLPREVRARVIETWGDPRRLAERLSEAKEEDEEEIHFTKLSLGLHDGKIVIPGLRFGNIVIVPQPKRGCAGARCDGKVCKILHDPTCPPPHQWLAIYWWLENKFKADVIIHVGTHGYLEFLPGKQCGLSYFCFPQISISHVPHLYVYNVTNPMEGVIAKRRSYAVIIDHMHPAMKFTEGYNELRELNDLVEEYYRARNRGDKDRMKHVFSKIVEVSKKAGLYKAFKDEGEFVEYLHSRLEEMESTLFRSGLHILGEPLSTGEAAELVTAVLRLDIGSWPSILRSLAQCMGLNYDKIVNEPHKINEKFNTTNAKVLKILMKYAVEIFKKLLPKLEERC